MSMIKLEFKYITGIKRDIFTSVILYGTWDNGGMYSEIWTEQDMEKYTHTDGCLAYRKEIAFAAGQEDKEFKWGAFVNSQQHQSTWGIPEEIKLSDSTRRYKTFHLSSDSQSEEFYLTHCRRLGANKYYQQADKPGIRFAVWAPNAVKAEVVFGIPETGYISDAGEGINPAFKTIELLKEKEGIWGAGPANFSELADFTRFLGRLYMFRITRDDGTVVYKTDIYSRKQAGQGSFDPQGKKYEGAAAELESTVSCSVIIDPDTPPAASVSVEMKQVCPINNLIIYELSVNALGYGEKRHGNLIDAIKLIPYLKELGINSVELLPLAEPQGDNRINISTTHLMAVAESAAGREKLKEFINLCHQNQILVIYNVIYNHFSYQSERSFWKFDSNNDDTNIYFWYEGKAADYPYDAEKKGHMGGYIDNNTGGFAPRYYEEMVRKVFISSAVTFMEEFNVDGFRYSLVSSIHNNNKLSCNKSFNVNSVNIYGAKFLREINRTLRLINKHIILIAEDHSQWDRITKPLDFNIQDDDGLGFDAVWLHNFYLHLVGDTTANEFSYARLIYEAGFGESWPLKMDLFAYQGLMHSKNNTIVYHEFYDTAMQTEDFSSQRTFEVASHFSMSNELIQSAEARCRFTAGMMLLSAGIPMLFMFEEILARNRYRIANSLSGRENYLVLKSKEGRNLFNFYKQMIDLRKKHSALRSDNIKLLYINNTNRIIAFIRRDETESLIIIASLNNLAFDQGYEISHYEINGSYVEIFNSDNSEFGGKNTGNSGCDIFTSNNSINPILPANGFIVLSKKEAKE